MASLGVTQYLVFIRPKNARGRIVYGAELGATTDQFGNVIKGETLLVNDGAAMEDAAIDVLIAANKQPDGTAIPVGKKISDMPYRSNTDIPESEWKPVTGQPFILYSTHFGVEEALKQAKPLIIAYGQDNVKICKLLNHELDVRMA